MPLWLLQKGNNVFFHLERKWGKTAGSSEKGNAYSLNFMPIETSGFFYKVQSISYFWNLTIMIWTLIVLKTIKFVFKVFEWNKIENLIYRFWYQVLEVSGTSGSSASD